MGRRTSLTVGPLAAASANNVCLSQTPLGAGNLTLDGALVVGGVAMLDQPRHIIVTCAAAENTKTFTAYGTDWSGQPIQSLAVAGPAAPGAVDFGVSFATVTRIAVSAATTGAVTVGTNGVADSRPMFTDEFGYGPTNIQVNVSGTTNYTVRSSQDDPNGSGGFGAPLGLQNCIWIDHPDLTAQTVSAQSAFSACPKLIQLTLNSGTGAVQATITQLASPSI